MKQRLITSVVLTVLLVLALSTFLRANPLKAETPLQTIFIQSDGRIYPSTAPIQRNGDIYTLTGNAYGPIVIQKPNIMLDGAGYTVLGPFNGTHKAMDIIGLVPNYNSQVPYIIGVDLGGKDVKGVTIKNLTVKNFSIGTYIWTTNNTLTGNAVTDNVVGVLLSGSNNSITKNLIADNKQGLFFGFNEPGAIPSDILISHNGFEHNTMQLSGCVCKEYNLSETRHAWDDGKEGNYWSNYNGSDANQDGIGDMPYIIDVLNQDRYPLMQTPVSAPTSTAQLPIEILILIVPVALVAIIVALRLRKKKT